MRESLQTVPIIRKHEVDMIHRGQVCSWNTIRLRGLLSVHGGGDSLSRSSGCITEWDAECLQELINDGKCSLRIRPVIFETDVSHYDFHLRVHHRREKMSRF